MMKKVMIAMAALAFISLPVCLEAQDEKQEKKEVEERIERKESVEKNELAERKETREIVIRDKGDKELNLKSGNQGGQHHCKR